VLFLFYFLRLVLPKLFATRFSEISFLIRLLSIMLMGYFPSFKNRLTLVENTERLDGS